jgi:pilus assembly protein CpaB
MKIRIVLLILAIVFGIAAVFGVMIYLNNVRSSIEKESELVGVLVATQNISKEMPVGEIITKKYVELKQIPKRYLVEGALDSLEKYKDYVAVSQINKGEQITQNKIIKPAEISIAFSVPDGMLAISIPFDEVIGVSNLINVGDKVNIIATFEPENEETAQSSVENETSSGGFNTPATESTINTSGATTQNTVGVIEPVTKVLIWSVEVLYIGTREVSKNEEEKSNGGIGSSNKNEKKEIKTVTLAVTPQQAEKLVFTEEIGKVWLALVPAKGIEEEKTPGRTYENIFD